MEVLPPSWHGVPIRGRCGRGVAPHLPQIFEFGCILDHRPGVVYGKYSKCQAWILSFEQRRHSTVLANHY